MLFDEDNTGLLAFMVGIAIVVFSGIGLSIIIDRRISSSTSIISLEKSVKNGQAEHEELLAICQDLTQRQEMIETSSGNAVAELESLRRDYDYRWSAPES